MSGGANSTHVFPLYEILNLNSIIDSLRLFLKKTYFWLIMDATCSYCKEEVSQKNALDHFLSCQRREQLFEKMKQKLVNQWFYIRVQSSPYWIDVIIPKQSMLDDLDHYLRCIWLECCGHLSHFRIQELEYERFQSEDWLIEGEELSLGMDINLKKVLDLGSKFSHFYDYGSTTELQLEVLKELQFPVKKSTLLCARNKPPVFECSVCKKTASKICGIFQNHSCEKCVKLSFKNSCCSEDTFLPLLNSPRTGVCGYDGTL